MPCLIYCLQNKTNDKKYVGQTWNKISRRITNHKSRNSCRKIFAAIKKYGADYFNVIILSSVDDQEKADQLEMFWIAAYDCVEHGYNLTHGGQGHKTVSDETRQKMSQAKQGYIPWSKGKTFSVEHRQHISENHARPCLGRVHSEISREKMKATLALGAKGKKITQEIANVIRSDFATENYSQRELAVKYNLSRANVCMIVNNKIW
jgi:group I intron endonuclease